MCGKGLGVTKSIFKVKRLGQRKVFRLVCVNGLLPAISLLYPFGVLLGQLFEELFIIKRLSIR